MPATVCLCLHCNPFPMPTEAPRRPTLVQGSRRTYVDFGPDIGWGISDGQESHLAPDDLVHYAIEQGPMQGQIFSCLQRQIRMSNAGPLALPARVCSACPNFQHPSERPKYRKCAGCLAVYYCSRECQKHDWRERHKAMCRGLRFGCSNFTSFRNFAVAAKQHNMNKNT